MRHLRIGKQTLTILTILALAVMSFTPAKSGFYEFKTLTIDGEKFNFSSLKGKKVMIVNVASLCGSTPQYEALQALYVKYSSQGFIILGFPANNFKNQEPGTNADIKQFCSTNYGVTFPMMSKVSVKGDDIDPIYRWLTQKSFNGRMDSEVKWNFQKYLIDEKGNLVDVAYTREAPNSERIIKWIEGN